MVLIMAGVSREHGADLLAIIYPQRQELYLQVLVAVPVLLLMWMAGVRHRLPAFPLTFWRHGRGLTLLVLIYDVAQQCYHWWAAPLRVTMVDGVILVMSGWFCAYLVRSRRVRLTFDYN